MSNHSLNALKKEKQIRFHYIGRKRVLIVLGWIILICSWYFLNEGKDVLGFSLTISIVALIPYVVVWVTSLGQVDKFIEYIPIFKIDENINQDIDEKKDAKNYVTDATLLDIPVDDHGNKTFAVRILFAKGFPKTLKLEEYTSHDRKDYVLILKRDKSGDFYVSVEYKPK